MNTIWKFELTLDERQVFNVPLGNVKPLCVQFQNNAMCLWCQVEDTQDRPTGMLEVAIVETGRLVPPDYEYVGSIQTPPYVWHIYYKRIKR